MKQSTNIGENNEFYIDFYKVISILHLHVLSHCHNYLLDIFNISEGRPDKIGFLRTSADGSETLLFLISHTNIDWNSKILNKLFLPL